MGRAPCCEKESVKRGPWTPEEDAKLLACIAQHGTGSWRTLPKKAGLQRCGKSCRLRWTNYLRPDLKHGRFSDQEEQLIVKLHAALGSRWSLIAAQLPGRTDNDVKNYWNTRLKKKLCEMGIDPITHKPISQLLADLAGSIALPKGSEIAEATLGCFKDDMLNVLMRKRPDQQIQASASMAFATFPPQQPWELVDPSSSNSKTERMFKYDVAPIGSSNFPGTTGMEAFAEKIKSGLSIAVQSKPLPSASFISSAPCGPVSGVRSASSALARSLAAIPTHQGFGNKEARGTSIGLPHLSSYDITLNEELSRSMVDMLLESNRSAASGSNLACGRDFSYFNVLNDKDKRSSSPALQSHAMDSCLIPAAITSTTEASQPSHASYPQQLPELPPQQLYMALLQQQESCLHPMNSGQNHSTPICQNSRETIAWSPSCSGSSSSNTSMPATEASSLEGVLSSDALLWDFSELSSMIS